MGLRRFTIVVIAGALCAASACSSDDSRTTARRRAVHATSTTTTSTTTPASAPWSAAALPATTPHPQGTGCRALAFADLGEGAGATPRHNGDAVAWDLPGHPGQNPDGSPNPTSGRSAFGILETHVDANTAPLNSWAFQVTWADGSSAGYGYEGETDPIHDPNPLDTTNWLAQVHVTGVDCVVDVWSNLGRAHLELLLRSLRFVAQ